MNVLFVDDEPAILGSMRRLLRSTRGHWRAHFVESAAGALEYLATHPVDVVVTDCQMPGMNGIALLEQLESQYPQVTRIMLSGQVSLGAHTLRPGLAHEFFAKPCTIKELCDAIERIQP